MRTSGPMDFGEYCFGEIEIDGRIRRQDVVIDRGRLRKRKKGPSKHLRDHYGHTPLSLEENIPWKCRRLVIGTGGQGALPLTPEMTREAKRRQVELVALPTPQAIEILRQGPKRTNAVLHITC